MISLEKIRNTLSDKLVKYRELKGWEQHDLAAAANIKVETLRNWEQKRRWPKPREIEKLAKALGVQPHDLFISDGDNPTLTPKEAIEVLTKYVAKTQDKTRFGDIIVILDKISKEKPEWIEKLRELLEILIYLGDDTQMNSLLSGTKSLARSRPGIYFVGKVKKKTPQAT